MFFKKFVFLKKFIFLFWKCWQLQKGPNRFAVLYSFAMNYFKQMSISSKSFKIAPAWVLSNGTLCIFIFEIGTGCINRKCSILHTIAEKFIKKFVKLINKISFSNVKRQYCKNFYMEHPVLTYSQALSFNLIKS